MRTIKLRWRSIAQVMLFSAAAFLVCGTALALTTPVNGFVIINPISVCSGGSCAAYGVSCTASTTGTPVCTRSPAPSSATTTTPIGFVDKDTNVNLTRAFWAQAGIDVVFFPVQSYNSPTNTDPWPSINDASTGATFSYTSTNPPTTYQTLHLVSVLCSDGFPALTSPDFQALTQHPICTEHGGLAPGVWSKLANPPPVPSSNGVPAPPPLAINGCSQAIPCSTNSNAIDVFFVNTYLGTGVSPQQYGFSWINGDGVSIGSGPFAIASPRYDTLAHEIGHALGLDHTSFGAPTDLVPMTVNSVVVGNMMLLGSTRATSYNSGCQQKAGFFLNPPPIYNNGALYDLDYNTSSFIPCGTNVTTGLPIGSMSADHLTAGPACTDPQNLATCTNQEAAAAISPFINKTSSSNAGGGSCAPFCPTTAATISTSATRTSTTSSSGTPTPLSITITATGDPNAPDLASNIIALLPHNQLSFNGNSPVTQIGGTPKDPTKPCDANHLNNCVVTVTSVVKLSNQTVSGNPGCDSGTGQPPSAQCVKITYSAPFRPGVFVVLAVSFNKDQGTIIAQELLAGAQYTTIDADGFATTSLFAPVFDSSMPPNAIGINANSANPDLTTPNVLLNASTFQNASAVKLGPKLSKCTPPYITVVSKNGKQTETVCPDGNLPDGPD